MSNPFETKMQTLTATRTVPFPAQAIYAVVSDVSQYSSFLPFCRESIVTKESSPDSNGKTWPEEAKLLVGYNSDLSETFWSRVYCDGSKVVEAVAGESETTLSKEQVAHHSARGAASDDPTRKGSVLTHLLTRWTLRPFPFKPGPLKSGQGEAESPLPSKEQTEVNLTIEYKFSNPMYAAMSAAATPKVAEYMMEAFEKRVRAKVDGPSHSEGKKIDAIEGVLRPGKTEP